MSTVRQLLNNSARLINITQANEELTDDEMDVMLGFFHPLIDSYSNNSLLIYNRSEHVFALDGSLSYTLGPTGDWDIERPMEIECAFSRINNGTGQQLDIPMQQLTFAQYAAISVKNTSSTFPFAFYSDNNFPLTNVTVFPIAAGPADIVLWLRDPLVNFDDINEEVIYPPGYERLFTYNLAVEVSAVFGKKVSDLVLGIATASKEEVERLNIIPRYIQGQGNLSRNRRGKYFNWITGEFFNFRNS